MDKKETSERCAFQCQKERSRSPLLTGKRSSREQMLLRGEEEIGTGCNLEGEPLDEPGDCVNTRTNDEMAIDDSSKTGDGGGEKQIITKIRGGRDEHTGGNLAKNPEAQGLCLYG